MSLLSAYTPPRVKPIIPYNTWTVLYLRQGRQTISDQDGDLPQSMAERKYRGKRCFRYSDSHRRRFLRYPCWSGYQSNRRLEDVRSAADGDLSPNRHLLKRR
jgi:hypothetical protein